ncbi:FAD-dependent oxidoreductase [Porticoccaceae bacterium LTM1]|nr:FAD-dependent oxidoreductase [Porticoccaceae bacterium LTM1]
MKVAIIGTGISGNVMAYHLCAEHQVTVFEANDYVGGHTHTHEIEVGNQTLAVDSGFIVFNRKTYPNFVHLLRQLGVEWQESCMSFSVRCERSGLEYNGTNMNGLFAQRRNLLNPAFYRFLSEIIRFNRESIALLNLPNESLTFGEFLRDGGYSQRFIDSYIIPMGAAIWSTSAELMLKFPAQFFIRFFDNHGMLSIDERPQWYVIKGGSKEYVKKLCGPFADRIRLNCPVTSVRRFSDRVEITSRDGVEAFDVVIFACHSDQALILLSDPDETELKILSAFPYQKNTALLHSDVSVMPTRRRAWASWNYRVRGDGVAKPIVSYHMNRLQSLPVKQNFFVTLNDNERINPKLVLRELTYHHPLFTVPGIAAQKRHREINGVNRTFFAGAYWRYGFHEDGVVSALDTLEHFRQWRANEQLSLRRMG